MPESNDTSSNSNKFSPVVLWAFLKGHGELILFAICFLYSALTASVGWNNPLLDAHGHRQCQTAISAYYMVDRLPTLAYETPVLGPPWTIPFEFPFYQRAVAAIVTLFDTPLDQTGRFVGLLCFWLMLVPLYHVLNVFDIAPKHRFLILSLVVVNPFYIFWSRTFMIESTVLLFCVTFLATSVSYVDSRSPLKLVWCIFWGILGALQKITTFVPFLGAFFLVLLYYRSRQGGSWPVWLRDLAIYALVSLVTLGTTVAWIQYADFLKSQSVFGELLTSTNITAWNWGKLANRFDLGYMYYVSLRQVVHVIYNPAVLIFCLATVPFITNRRWQIGICIVCFLSAPVTFANLHTHSYYVFANLVFMIVALGLCTVGLIELGSWRRYAGITMLVLLLLTSVYQHQSLFMALQARNPVGLMRISQHVRNNTSEDDVLVVYGWGWSSELPYYSQRRALMMRHAEKVDLGNKAIASLHGEKVGALVVTKSETLDISHVRLEQRLEQFQLSRVPSFDKYGVMIYPTRRYERAYRDYREGLRLVRKNEHAEAIKLFDRAIEQHSADPQFYIDRAGCHLKTGNSRAMLADFERALDLDASDPGSYSMKAQMLFKLFMQKKRRELLQQAVECADQAVDTAPQVASFYKIRSQILEHTFDRSDEAERDRQTAEKLSRRPRKALTEFGELSSSVLLPY